MIRLLMARARCALAGHAWPKWSQWEDEGGWRFIHHRNCLRCNLEEIEIDD